jgi:hypothetical protein
MLHDTVQARSLSSSVRGAPHLVVQQTCGWLHEHTLEGWYGTCGRAVSVKGGTDTALAAAARAYWRLCCRGCGGPLRRRRSPCCHEAWRAMPAVLYLCLDALIRWDGHSI